MQKELLTEVLDQWNVAQLDTYLKMLSERKEQLDEWMRIVQNIRRAKVKQMNRKKPLDNGTRGGLG